MEIIKENRILINSNVNESSESLVVEKNRSLELNMPNVQLGIDDLIGNSPGWLLRSGIAAVFFVVIIIIIISALIKFPDKITSSGIITSKNPPIELYSKVNSRVESILSPTGTFVSEGDPILYLSNNTNVEDVNRIKEVISALDLDDFKSNLKIQMPEKVSLGRLQSNYGKLYLKMKEFQQVIRNTGVANQIENIKEEIYSINSLNTISNSEMQLYSKEESLMNHNFERHLLLFEEGVISELNLEEKKLELSQFYRHFESLKRNGVQYEIRKEALESQLLRTIEERNEQLQRYQFTIRTLVEDLKMLIIDWEESYYVKAEVDGIVELSDDIKLKSLLDRQTMIGYISPDTLSLKYARVLVAPHRIGEIKIGDKCLLKLDAFPYKKYGVIVSKIGSLSKLSTKQSIDNKSLYEVIIPMKMELSTEYGEVIPFNPNMSFEVDIITMDRSLLNRILSKFYDILLNT